MIYPSAAQGDPGAPVIYVTDAARAADAILRAPKDKFKMVHCCFSGIHGALSVSELETDLENLYPKTQIAYRAKENGLPVSAVKIFDDYYARKE